MPISEKMSSRNRKALLNKLLPRSRYLAAAAFELGYTVIVYGKSNLIKITKGSQTYFARSSRTMLNTLVSSFIADDKLVTSMLLEEAGIPTAKSRLVTRSEIPLSATSRIQMNRLKQLIRGLTFPLVVKPARGTVKGEGVLTNIKNIQDLLQYIHLGLGEYPVLLIEEFYAGLQDYRVLVLDNEVIDVLHRVPAYVIGDGKKTIKQLILQKNRERMNNKKAFAGLIHIDAELKNMLKNKKIRLSSIPKREEYIQLKNVCNFGAGGEVHVVSKQICKENIDLAIRVAQTLHLRFTGIDFLCTDISQPLTATDGIIIEVNEHPDFAMHMQAENANEDIPKKIIKAMFT